MFWRQGAILRGFIKKKDYKYNIYLGTSRTCPFYVFNSDMEALANMRRCVTDGLDWEIVVTIQRVLNVVNPFVEMFLRASEFKEIKKFSAFDSQAWGIYSSPCVTRCLPFYVADNIGAKQNAVLNHRVG